MKQNYELDPQEKYFGAFVTSNEPQREITAQIPGDSVLTVAGSGDQAIFYKIAGKKHIDTYDISPFSRIIQDIKVVAINNLNLNEYIKLINNVFRCQFRGTGALKNVLGPLYNKLPAETQYLIEQNHPMTCWFCGLPPSTYPMNYPTDDEYKKLQASHPEPFNFIWSDVADLADKVTKKYDIINISNIFDYTANHSKADKTINQLTNMLNIGGRIISLTQYIHPSSHPFTRVQHNNGEHSMKIDTIANQHIMSIQRIR